MLGALNVTWPSTESLTGQLNTSPSGILRSPPQITAGIPFLLKRRSVPRPLISTRSVLSIKRESAVYSNVIGLGKWHSARFPRRAYQRDGHFVRNIECLNEDRFITLETDRIFHQKFREFIKPGVVHRLLSFHQHRRTQPTDATRFG